MIFVIKTLIAALILSFSSWLAHKKPELAGFIVALPLVSILALFFSYAEFKDAPNAIQFAKGIFWGRPASLLFFVPFLFAEKWNLSFWGCWISGIVLLVIGFIIHRAILNY